MAGMRPFVLREENASAYCNALAAADCPSSQIAIDKLSAVPLWKVIVGPAPTNCKPDSQESGFLFHPTRRFHPNIFIPPRRAPRCRIHIFERGSAGIWGAFVGCLRNGQSRSILVTLEQGFNTRETTQWLGRPRPSSRSASASRSTATCRPSSDPSRLNGAPYRHRARLGGGWWISPMELSLPDMSAGMVGRRACAAPYAGQPRRQRRR